MRSKQLVLITSCTSMLFGCGDPEETQETEASTTRKQPIVFGVANAKNQPNQELDLTAELLILSSASPPVLESISTERMFRKLMASRASPQFDCRSYDGSYDSMDGQPNFQGCGRASGLLGASNIVWTADHTVDYYVDNQSTTQPATSAPGSPPIPIFPPNSPAIVFSVDWFDVRPFNLVAGATMTNGLRNVRDTWYLRHRLHGLGLTKYIESVSSASDYEDQIRKPFETWYHPDFETIKRYGVPHTDVGGMTQSTTDVAWVKLSPRMIVGGDPNGPDKLLVKKPFQLGGPGMFFGFYRALCATGSDYYPDLPCDEPKVSRQQLINHFATNIPQTSDYVHTSAPTAPSPWSTHGYNFAFFMYEKLMTQDVIVNGGAAFDNHIREAPFTGSPIYSTQPTTIGSYSSPGVPIQRAMRVQLDARQGHSGGPILTDPSNARSPDLGPFHAVVSQLQSQIAGLPAIESAGYHYGPVAHNTSQAEMYAGVIGGYMAEEVRKETGNEGTPWRSSLDDCEDLELCTDDCIELNPSNIDNCRTEFESETGDSTWGSVAPPKRDPSITASLCLGQGCDNGAPPSRSQSSVKQLQCKDRYMSTDSQRYFGSGLGVVGGHMLYEEEDPLGQCSVTQVESPNSNAVLGTVGLVCGPRSKRDWSMNWDFLRVDYRDLDNDCLHTSFTYMLNAYLGRNYLVREEVAKGDQSGNLDTSPSVVSPAPMLLCPPGYAMQGLKVNYDPENEVITGIQGVFCSDVAKSAADDECQSDPSKRSSYPCFVAARLDDGNGKPIFRGEDASMVKVATSELSDERFELPTTQYLGNPANTSGSSENAICPDDQQVVSLWVSSSFDDATRFIDVNCGYKPGMSP